MDSNTTSLPEAHEIDMPLAHSRIAIHDPAIVEDNGVYYIFGTHRRCARSTDMVHWERFENNLSCNPYSVLGDIWQAWPKQPENPDLLGNTWAPDVIWNPTMNKWCMYMSVNGHEFRSVIVLLVADRLDGDWRYVGPVVYSGFTSDNVDATDVPRVLGEEAHGDLARYQSLKDTRINAIDAAPIICEHGEMWMSVGSWFGGIWMIKLDPTTGLRDYGMVYPLRKDSSDPYYGVKIAGGYWNSGEGSYFVRKTAGGTCSCRMAGWAVPAATRSACSAPAICWGLMSTSSATPPFPTVRYRIITRRAQASVSPLPYFGMEALQRWKTWRCHKAIIPYCAAIATGVCSSHTTRVSPSVSTAETTRITRRMCESYCRRKTDGWPRRRTNTKEPWRRRLIATALTT